MGIETAITKQLGIEHPIVCAPMFLCSNLELVAAVSNAGGLGTFPALNYRTAEELDNALTQLKKMTGKPYGVNIIANSLMEKKNEEYLEVCIAHKTPLYITSLGTPKRIIETAHKHNAHAWCDVTSRGYAEKAQELGADAVVAVTAGAGGHAGKATPTILIPELKHALDIPVLQAGGIADSKSFNAALELGADAAYMGTRFIATEECTASQEYKQAIINATSDDIVMTDIISGTPCSVINTEYVQKAGELNWLLKKMIRSQHKTIRKLARGLVAAKGISTLKDAFGKNPYKKVFIAGQTAGLIHKVEPAQKIIKDIAEGYHRQPNNRQP